MSASVPRTTFFSGSLNLMGLCFQDGWLALLHCTN
jgi:hypothetical protein